MRIQEKIFIGAYNERKSLNSADFLTVKAKNAATIKGKATKAIEAIKAQRDSQAATLSLTKENRDFLCSEAGYEKMKKDVEDLYTQNAVQQKELMNNNENDPFWSNTGNQWLVFSENSYKNGFYENMSDKEVKEAETLWTGSQFLHGFERSKSGTGICHCCFTFLG